MKKQKIIAIAAALMVIWPTTPGDTAKPAIEASGELPRSGLIAPMFSANQGETRGVLLIEDGAVKAKRYPPGYSDATRFISWSMAKSVTAVLIGELVADGKLSLDAPVPFVQWQTPGDPRAMITLRQMLHMSSGLDHTEVGEPVYASDTNQTLFVAGTGAMAKAALDHKLEAAPGATFEYSSITSLLLSELITQTLTDSRDPRVRAAAYRDFAQTRVLGPAGITSAVFDFDGAGTQVGGSIIYMTLDDWGRFGQLLIDGKGASQKQIIAPHWLTFLAVPSVQNGGYGAHVWLNRPQPPGGDAALFPELASDSVFAAIGHLGQYVIVMPKQRSVLVRLGKTNDPELGPVRDTIGKITGKLAPR